MAYGIPGIAFADTPAIDAFGRLRVGQPTLLIDLKRVGSTPDLLATTAVGGSGVAAYQANRSSTYLQVGGGVGTAVRQTKARAIYQPGKCHSASDYLQLADGSLVQYGALPGQSFRLKTIRDGAVVEVDAFAEMNAFETVYEIELANGMRLRTNAQHPFWVGRKVYKTKDGRYAKGRPPLMQAVGFTPVSGISVGDHLAVAATSPYEGGEVMPDAEVRFLAYMVAEGSLSRTTTFSQNPGAVRDDFCACAKALGISYDDAKVSMPLRAVHPKDRHRPGLNPARELLRKHGLLGLNSHTVRVPAAIWRCRNAVIRTFLRHLYAGDGWATVNDSTGCPEIGYCSASRGLAEDVQRLLHRLGVCSQIVPKSVPGYGVYWNVVIYRSREVIAFADRVGIFAKEQAVGSAKAAAECRALGKPQDRHLDVDVPADGFRWCAITRITECAPETTIAVCVPGDETYIGDVFEHNSLLSFTTFVLAPGQANLRQRVGYFDPKNGIFLELNGTTAYISRRTYVSGAAVDTPVAQASWNIDRFNGAGPSGITLDFTKPQILVTDLEWLGVGRVRVGFVVNGLVYYAHQFLNTNAALTSVYMTNPNLPIRWEIEALGAVSGTPILEAICASVNSEGGYDITGITAGTDMGTVLNAVAAGATEEILAVRMQSAFTEFATAFLQLASVLAATSSNFLWSIVLNPTETGAGSWSSVANSIMEKNTTRTVTAGTGMVLASGYVSANANSIALEARPVLTLGTTLAGVTDVLSLQVTNLGAGGESYLGSLNWREVY